jgi:sterol 3beta-glucosyltransferase
MLDPDSNKNKDEIVHIKLVTKTREYRFKADNPQGARDWVKQLQRVIFKSHNDGDSVKICLPINNVIDLEETQFLDVSDTVKLRVIDNNETYAVDDVSTYSFSFVQAADGLKVLLCLFRRRPRGHLTPPNHGRSRSRSFHLPSSSNRC